MRENAERLVEQHVLAGLPTLPAILLRLIQSVRAPDATLRDVAAVVAKDTALTARTISLAKLGSRMGSGKLESLESLVEAAGLDAVRALAHGSSISLVFSQASSQRRTYLQEFWRHAMASAAAARLIADRTASTLPNEAYLAGLLHNVGQLLLVSQFPAEYQQLRAGHAIGHGLLTLEEERFGTNHCEIGALLIRRWNIRSFLADALLYHHEPAASMLDAHELVKTVHLANSLSDEAFAPSGVVADQARALFGIPPLDVAALIAQTREQVEGAAEFCGIAHVLQETKREAPADRDQRVLSLLDQARREVETRAHRGALETHPEHPEQEPHPEANQRARLVKEVRNFSLLESARPILTGTREPAFLPASLQQAAGLLLGIERTLVFLYVPEENALVGHGRDDGDDPVSGLRVELERGRSLIAETLLLRRPTHSYEERWRNSLSVVDRQIIGLTNKQGALYLPMTVGETNVGILVIGVNEADIPSLQERWDLVNGFSQGAAEALNLSRTRRAEGERRERERQRSLDRRLRQFLHEAGNPLTLMGNSIEILSNRLQGDQAAQEDLKVLRDEMDHVRSILRTLPEIPESAKADLELIDINELLSQLLEIFHESLFDLHNIDAELVTDDSMPPVAGEPLYIRDVLTNLLRNAAEAMADGGQISIRTEDNVRLDGNEYVEITVSDTGPGIPSSVLGSLFGPITSTKGEGHAGMGLTIVKDRIKELGGFIGCKTKENVGTTFTILLPRRTTAGSNVPSPKSASDS